MSMYTSFLSKHWLYSAPLQPMPAMIKYSQNPTITSENQNSVQHANFTAFFLCRFLISW